MAKWESDRYVDEVYDEWCKHCGNYSEHSMGVCLPCSWTKPVQIKNKFSQKTKAKKEGGG